MPETYDKKTIADLLDAKLGWPELHEMMSSYKDPDRFDKYISVLQDRAPWPEQILLPLGPHLFIVKKANGEIVTKSTSGFEFGDYRENWKLNASVYVRRTEEAMTEVYPRLMAPDTEWQVYREYYCPQCGAMHDVEAPTPWYPVIHDFEPDIEAFYKDWVQMPLPERAN